MRNEWFSWNDANGGQVPDARLRVRCEAPAALWVTVRGIEHLIGVGTDFDVDGIPDAGATWRLQPDVNAQVYVPPVRAFRASGPIFTNPEIPMESESVLEVKRALRLFGLEQQAHKAEIVAATQALKAEREALRQERSPVPEEKALDEVPEPEAKTDG